MAPGLRQLSQMGVLAVWLASAASGAAPGASGGVERVDGAGLEPSVQLEQVEALVEREGAAVVAIDADFSEVAPLDAYATHGRGSLEEALRGIHAQSWRDESLGAFVRWLRAYNGEPRHRRKVRLFGFDMQQPGASARALARFLEQLGNPEPDIQSQLVLLGRERPEPDAGRVAPDLDAACEEAVRELDELLGDASSPLRRRAGAAAWSVAERETQVLLQSLEYARRARDPRVRTRAQLENLRWIAAEAPGAKWVVWTRGVSEALDLASLGDASGGATR